MSICLRDSVVVITGASSGIGRAAAIAFARRGANVVLAARNALALEEVAAECTSIGVRALAVPTDVRDESAVRGLARLAFETFGKIDVWVNNASVVLYARIEEAPYETYRRVIETNLLGYVHGVRSVLPYFRLQGRGVLINNASVLGKVGEKYLSAYAISKFGIVGLGESVRQELFDTPDIHVCTLLPATIDTPIYQHAGNYTGRAVRAQPPVYGAQRVARAMVALAMRPRTQRYVGMSSYVITAMHTLAPGLSERLIARYMERAGLQDRAAPGTDGTIFAPSTIWTGVSGGWRSTKGLPGIFELLRGLFQLAIDVPIVTLERFGKGGSP